MIAEIWLAVVVLANGQVKVYEEPTRLACIDRRIWAMELFLYSQTIDGQKVKDASKPCHLKPAG